MVGVHKIVVTRSRTSCTASTYLRYIVTSLQYMVHLHSLQNIIETMSIKVHVRSSLFTVHNYSNPVQCTVIFTVHNLGNQTYVHFY